MQTNPVVSICCITYNHEAFLGQAIDSALMQRTNFPIEIVIGEDCSTDGTRSIAKDYALRYPGIIRVLTPDNNLGIMPNLIATMAVCKGEFIAFLEGDDYWTDADKLQKQVDILRANPECAMCFHDAEIFYNSEFLPPKVFSQKVAPHVLPVPTDEGGLHYFSQLDLARLGWIMPSASMLFRATSLPKPLPEWFSGIFSGDYTLQLLSTRNGCAVYIAKIMSRYRLHENGITHLTAQSHYQFRKRIYEGKMFKKHVFKGGDKKFGDKYLSNQYIGYAHYLGSQNLYLQQLGSFLKAIFYDWERVPSYVKRKFIHNSN